MEARRASRQATVETDDEDEKYTLSRRRLEGSSEEGIGSGELKDLMRTLQSQSEAAQAHSQMISHLVQERGMGDFDRLSNIPEDSNIQVLSYLDDEFRQNSFQNSLQDFAFPPLDQVSQPDLSSPVSRTSSCSMSNTSVPSSPATSMSSTSSLSLPLEHRRLPSACSPRGLPFATPSPNLPSSPTVSFSGSSSFTPNLNRRVSFGPSSSRMPSTATKSSSGDMTVEKALSAPLPNKYQGSRRSHSRTISLPVPQRPQRSQQNLLDNPSEQALSYPPLNRYPPRSYEPPQLPTFSSLPSTSTSVRMGIGSRSSTFTAQTRGISKQPLQPLAPHRSSSFSSQTKNRHTSLQLVQPPSHRRPSDIPSKEQWRSSLKSGQSPTSSVSHSPTLSNASTSSSPQIPTLSAPRTSYSTPTPKSNTISDSFHNIVPLATLSQLTSHFPFIQPTQIAHNASIWSYAETLHQFLHPDHISPSSSPMTRIYLSSAVRSYIFSLAFSISEKEKEQEGEGFVLLLFLLRFVMQFGVENLEGAPTQAGDPTGLREVEERYKVVGEILEVIEREGEGDL